MVDSLVLFFSNYIENQLNQISHFNSSGYTWLWFWIFIKIYRNYLNDKID